MTGHICPECGTDNGAGGRSGGGRGTAPGTGCACACGQWTPEQYGTAPGTPFEQHRTAPGATPGATSGAPAGTTAEQYEAQYRAAERQRAERSAADEAERAAAEDFDPLRIRPYVTLGNDPSTAAREESPGPRGPHGPAEEADATMPLRLDPTAGPGAGPATGPMAGATGSSGMPETTALDSPFAPPSVLSSSAPTTPIATGTPPEEADRRRRPFVAAAMGAVAIAAVGTAAFASGLLGGGSGETDHEQALPSTVASLPDATLPPEESASASASASPSSSPAPATPSTPAPTNASPSPSASTTASRPSIAPSTTPSKPADPTATDAPPPSLTKATLRYGDQGPGVTELQHRLTEIRLYADPADGNYTDRVEYAVNAYQSYRLIKGDPPGVYGPHTRRALEAETTGRGNS
ncbi:peptidoglycan-binding protein [Streptomyces sp. NPDC015184]|uniref:peptidoglycan-binding domain-containing protein n=1 Tax=Streptomyces sp. NPDC015184 TaxID=3364946 RepID=UPI0036FF0678